MVFVEATDTADLRQQDTGLQELLRAGQTNQSNRSDESPVLEEVFEESQAEPQNLVTGRFEHSLSDQQMSDYELALRVQEETRRQQELSDFEVSNSRSL